MSKSEVLEQVYPDELDYIFEQGRIKEIQRLEGYITQMHSFGSGKSSEKWFERIVERYNTLTDAAPDKPQEPEEDPIERLKQLKRKIDKTRKTKRKGGD